MKQDTPNTVGVDISKTCLDAHRRQQFRARHFPDAWGLHRQRSAGMHLDRNELAFKINPNPRRPLSPLPRPLPSIGLEKDNH